MLKERGAKSLLATAALALLLLTIQRAANTARDIGQTDFGNYFAAAKRVVSARDLRGAYDREAFLTWMRVAGIGRLGSFVPQPPTNALWLAPFARFDPSDAKAAWTATLIVALVAAFAIGRAMAPTVPATGILLILLAPIDAVGNGLAYGQPYILLATVVLAAFLALARGHIRSAAFLLGWVAAFKPQMAPLGAVAFFVPGSWGVRTKVFVSFLMGVGTPVAALCALAGGMDRSAFPEFFAQILPRLVRGEIQDPFSPGWGSLSALARALLRLEPDLNPRPWADLPLLAEFLAIGAPAGVLAAAFVLARAPVDSADDAKAGPDPAPAEPILAAAGLILAATLAAAPLVQSYHLVLLWPVALVAIRRPGLRGGAVVLLLGLAASPLAHAFFRVEGAWSPLRFIRALLLLAILFLMPTKARHRSTRIRFGAAALAASVAGTLSGAIGLSAKGVEERWPPTDPGPVYAQFAPMFCEGRLGFWTPAEDGRTLQISSRAPGFEACRSARTENPRPAVSPDRSWEIVSMFREGSWNLYLRERDAPSWMRVTFSDANETEPAWSPDGESVVFASDEGRGLGAPRLRKLTLRAVRR